MFKNICIATFAVWKKGERTSINGMIKPLLSYFSPRSKSVDLIDGPHPGSSTVISLFENYKNKIKIKTSKSYASCLLYPFLSLNNNNATHIAFKLRDILATIEFLIRSEKKYDLFIGLESIYTITGILFKKMGIIKTVVYYVSDYSPNRYKNKYFNRLYLLLDRYCCYNADYIWDVSPAMQPARICHGLNPKKSKPVIKVPNALFPEQISYLPQSKIQKNTLVYAGTLTSENGADIAILSMPHILKKFPKAILHIIGGGSNEQKLKKLSQKLKLDKNIVFHGFITDVEKTSALCKKFMIGLAPYRKFKNSIRWYADATKIRLYFGAGLPVITTEVPPLGKDAVKKGAAIIVEDNPLDFAKAIVDILSNQKKYKRLRANAIAYAKNNTWENSYNSALLKMGLD
jgi:glycosyltransferase involved in cell wall biosynthesis